MGETKANIIKKCIECIQSFNPVTHSIDTHIQEQLKIKSKFNDEQKLFIQQVVYGWQLQKPVLDGFLDNFFADNAAFVARADKILYIIFSYLAIFRLDELGFYQFKEYCNTQDPTKMMYMISYLFNKENLWGCLRAEWMKKMDLDHVEDEIIAGIETFLSDSNRYMSELQYSANGLAAAQAEKQEALNSGKANLGEVTAKALTRAVSPKLSKQRPPRLPEPIEIQQKIQVNEVPSYLNNITLKTLEDRKLERQEATKMTTMRQYSESHLFKLHETKGGKDMEELKKTVEAERYKECQFDSSFYHAPPDVQKVTAKVRINAAAILREDALYKKQLAKDVELVQNYEMELRDASEYYAWQKEMKERDEKLKLLEVAGRRQQAKESGVEAREAMNRQKEDNKAVADILREQAEAIKTKKELEDEIRMLTNQEKVTAISIVRDTKPQEARAQVEADRVKEGIKLREELEAKLKAKQEEDALEEAIRADRIRQLKALNSVHKEHIVVFDPTQTAGYGLMSEMSYMEMKERLDMEKARAMVSLTNKRTEIVEMKEKKSHDLDMKSQSIMRARELKKAASLADSQRRREAAKREEELKEKARAEAAAILDEELAKKLEEKKEEQARLKAEADRIARQQQYLGVAMGRVDETRAEQLLVGQERETKAKQFRIKEDSLKKEAAMQNDRDNREVFARSVVKTKSQLEAKADELFIQEKRLAVEKLKKQYVEKKQKVRVGHEQHENTRTVVVEHNLYASRINQDSLERSRSQAQRVRGGM